MNMEHTKENYGVPGVEVGEVFRKFSHLFIEFEVILSATNSFSQQSFLGAGAFGEVYKGVAPDGSPWAVKRSLDPRAMESFIHEIVVMAPVRHLHIVELLGFSFQEGKTPELILVYELIPNGTVADALMRDRSGFSFEQRLRIAIGTATGLLHMHQGLKQGILHGDIKPENILLDDNFEPKLADFGLAKMILGCTRSSERQDATVTHHLAGSFGYMDPEFYETCKLTMKSDIFSLGVVILQLLTGKPAVFPIDNVGNRIALFRWVAKRRLEPESVRSIVDPALAQEGVPVEQLLRVFKLARDCVNSVSKRRPDIRHVLRELEVVQDMAVSQADNDSGTDGESSEELNEFSSDEDGAGTEAEVAESVGSGPSVATQGASVKMTLPLKNSEKLIQTLSQGAIPVQLSHSMEGLQSGNHEVSKACPVLPACSTSAWVSREEELFQMGRDLICKLRASGAGRRDFSAAAKFFALAADLGSADAQWQLSELYRVGLGVVRNYREERQWCVKAAKQGHISAVARCYQHGWGRSKDMDKARELYSEAAVAGDPIAQRELGQMYLNGFELSEKQTVPEKATRAERDQKAAEWLQKAAEQDDMEGQIKLGLCFYGCYGVPQDIEAAERWFSLATRDNVAACDILGCIFLDMVSPSDNKRAVDFFKQAIQCGDSTNPVDKVFVAKAHVRLGLAYLFGLGVTRDTELADTYLEKGAKLGNNEEQGLLHAWFKARGSKLSQGEIEKQAQLLLSDPELETGSHTHGGKSSQSS